MLKSKWADEQIIGLLQEPEAGTPVTEICRRLGLSKETFYRRRRMFGGLEVSDAKRPRQLEEENRQLKRVAVVRIPHLVPTGPNQRWSMGFVHDRRADGRPFRMLTRLDEGTRESPALVVGRSLTARHVITALDALAATRRLPHTIAVDNGTEFTSQALDVWAEQHGIQLDFSRPGKPHDNAFIESFNSRLRDVCLNEQWFTSQVDAQVKIEAFRIEYQTEHSHSSLGGWTPAEYAARFSRSAPAEITRLSA